MLSCEFCKFFKNIFFTEYIHATASVFDRAANMPCSCNEYSNVNLEQTQKYIKKVFSGVFRTQLNIENRVFFQKQLGPNLELFLQISLSYMIYWVMNTSLGECWFELIEEDKVLRIIGPIF